MIKFFRKIRKRILMENNKATIKIFKYLLYATGEIMLVVIGILIALQLNLLNEERKTRREEINSLTLIKSNLESEIIELTRFIDENAHPVVDYYTDIYNKNWDNLSLDSISLKGTTAFNYKSFSTAYEGLKANDKLSIIQNEDLKEKIIVYFEQERAQLLDWSDWHRSFVYNILEPYMFNELPINQNELVDDIDYLKEALERRRLNSLLSNQIGSLRRIETTIDEAKSYATEIIEMIDEVTLDK